MMFLGVLVKTENMTVSVTPDHLQKFITDGHSHQLTKSDSCADLQSLRGVIYVLCHCIRYGHCKYTVSYNHVEMAQSKSDTLLYGI